MPTVSDSLLPVEEVTRRIEQDCHLSFARWGDGEWRAVFGPAKGRNIDGTPHTEKLRSALIEALRATTVAQSDARKYCIHGMQRYALRKGYGPRIDALVPAYLWAEADVFHDTSQMFGIEGMARALKIRANVRIVGPPHLEAFARDVQAPFIPVHPKDSLPRDQERLQALFKEAPRGSLFALSAGMAANVYVYDCWRLRGREVSAVDFGSVWDPYYGVKSRTYMRDPARDFSVKPAI